MSVELLETAAAALGALTERVVFLGGATVGLWFTDPAARPPRATFDVDVVAEVVTLSAYADFQEQLRTLGFHEDIDSGIICRWRHQPTDLVLDAVPAETRLAGFGGRWLRPAADAAVGHALPSGARIKVVPPVYLVATKLEAFGDRGHDDCLASRDFEDLIVLVDSREELIAELQGASGELRDYVRTEFRRMLELPTFVYGAEGALLGADARARLERVTVPRLRELATT